jgi:hypothetical protein
MAPSEEEIAREKRERTRKKRRQAKTGEEGKRVGLAVLRTAGGGGDG